MIKKEKSLPQLKIKAQILFNEYVRLRDASGDHFKCISCGQIKPVRWMHCGHYYNVGHYDALRYDDDNAHGQCNHCNTFLHGNLIGYRDGLINKIGLEGLMRLETKAGYYKRNGHKFSRFDVEFKIKELRDKIKELNAR